MQSSPQQPQPSQPPAPIDLGIVSLLAAPGWEFYPLDDRVIGRPLNRVGGIQIVRLPDDTIPPPLSHERCMAAAVAASGYQIDPPGTDRAQEWDEACLAGGESFHAGDDFVRIWYRCCPDGSYAAWFACKGRRAPEKAVTRLVSQCDRMISSLRLPVPGN